MVCPAGRRGEGQNLMPKEEAVGTAVEPAAAPDETGQQVPSTSRREWLRTGAGTLGALGLVGVGAEEASAARPKPKVTNPRTANLGPPPLPESGVRIYVYAGFPTDDAGVLQAYVLTPG